MYVTEYRKALRDAGFDGFRVVLFQQTGGLKQATGEESGLEMNPTFFWAHRQGARRGRRAQRARLPHPPLRGRRRATPTARIEQCKKIVYDGARGRRRTSSRALWKCKPLLEAREGRPHAARSRRSSIIGEFWAMTTEGDGNYQLQRFLESEGAEADIQLVTAWLLYTVWEARARHAASAWTCAAPTRRSTASASIGPFGVAQEARSASARREQRRPRRSSRRSRTPAGLYGYHLPDMDEIAEGQRTSTTTTISAAAKATWRSASSS